LARPPIFIAFSIFPREAMRADSQNEKVDFRDLKARVELISDVFCERMVAIKTSTAEPLDFQTLLP